MRNEFSGCSAPAFSHVYSVNRAITDGENWKGLANVSASVVVAAVVVILPAVSADTVPTLFSEGSRVGYSQVYTAAYVDLAAVLGTVQTRES